MAHEPQKYNLEDILSALQDEQAMVREQAITRLEAYANLAGNEATYDTLSEAEAIKAWRKSRAQRMQDSRIVPAIMVAIEDSSARLRAHTALFLGSALSCVCGPRPPKGR